VFDGNSQVLDQIIVSRSLWDRDPDYDVVHVNAEFFDQASDHDPSVMRISFGNGNGNGNGHGHGYGGSGPKPPWWGCF
jgi:predicted extracellular nuclease